MQRAVIGFGVIVTVGVLVTVGFIVSGAGGEPAGAGGPAANQVPGPPDAVQARRTLDALAAVGAPLASGDGIVVESVAAGSQSRGPSTDAVRVTLQRGPFQVRDMPIMVRVDGRVVGRARPSPDLSSATAVTFDRSWLHLGAQVSWSYGELGSPSNAGTITAVNP